MASVCLAAIKIGSILLDFSPLQTLVSAAVITVLYSALGGLRGVIITDFFQFLLAMTATIWSAIVIVNLPQVGGLSSLISNPIVIPKLPVIPTISNFSFNDPQTEVLITVLILPLAVQWWSVWYPGAEPGGGGYIAQRMLSAKDEKNAIWATLLFNFMHYAIRPWPWILVALSSLIVFPNLDSLALAFPNVSADLIGDDLAYPAMMSFLPSGLLGLLIASLMAAFMSTLSTHLNWGASYIVHDFYHRFINPNASEKSLVLLARGSTLMLMIFAALVALTLQNALQAFQILLQIGAGTGLLFILRWFWYRINVYSEFTAMIVSFLLAIYLQLIHPQLGFETISSSIQLLIGVGATTISWIFVTLVTKPETEEVLLNFYQKVHPGGPGWKSVLDTAELKGKKITGRKEKWDVPNGILCMLFGTLSVYCILFSIGSLIYGNDSSFMFTSILGLLSLLTLFYFWKKGSNQD
jgi:Na+/proline symporter